MPHFAKLPQKKKIRLLHFEWFIWVINDFSAILTGQVMLIMTVMTKSNVNRHHLSALTHQALCTRDFSHTLWEETRGTVKSINEALELRSNADPEDYFQRGRFSPEPRPPSLEKSEVANAEELLWGRGPRRNHLRGLSGRGPPRSAATRVSLATPLFPSPLAAPTSRFHSRGGPFSSAGPPAL